jgi:CxxC motif-containing protein (DUF1111 family)
MRIRTIVGLIAGTTAATIVLVATAQVSSRPSFWPKTKGAAVVNEWYSDIPWHQKLGTRDGNEIDVALVLPYDALPPAEKDFCTREKLTEQQCMIEIGIVNVLGTNRIDTPYDPADPLFKPDECKDAALPCIEVKLDLSSFWTRSAAGGTTVELQRRMFGKDPPQPPDSSNDPKTRGYAITDGSTYAPQMGWFTSHYCDLLFPDSVDVQDPVCYADYLSPMNDGFNVLKDTLYNQWPKSIPWSVFPNDNPVRNHCKEGETTCTLVMAAFPLREVSHDYGKLQYFKYNDNLFQWFNLALSNYTKDFSLADRQRKFPWTGAGVTWEDFLRPQAIANPFLGEFDYVQTADPVPSDCDVDFKAPTNPKCTQTATLRAKPMVFPRQCELGDLAGNDVARLRKCGVNYELHHNGYLDQWPESYWPELVRAGMLANQYGRTSFLFGGVSGLQVPVSFLKTAGSDLNIYEQVYNASIFSLYLPIANVADEKNGYRKYSDTQFYHTLLMTNHMESDPWHFADGIRGKVLWHNEYRTEKMYYFQEVVKPPSTKFPAKTFAGAFDEKDAKAPFHNNTCDGCHLRNGSGVPIKTKKVLDAKLQTYMKSAEYNPYVVKDYTFTGQIRPMKLVFFDLKRDAARLDGSRYSEPLAFSASMVAKAPRTMKTDDLYYNTAVMNYYGDSFHETSKDSVDWHYVEADAKRLVVPDARKNVELGTTYTPWQVKLDSFTTNGPCSLVKPAPTTKPWPTDCKDVEGKAIQAVIDGTQVGFLFLNGKRLGNLSAMEAIPNQAIIDFRDAQKALLGDAIAGELIWNAGARDGIANKDSKVQKECKSKSLRDCFIGRFGWIGDRVSLEDQVANAAFVEMNMLTTKGYEKLYGTSSELFPIRYAHPNCGAANKTCVESKGNGELSERDVERMADYARWVGNPTRSDYKVALPEVIAGEKVFRKVGCDACHVVKRIDIVPDDTMVTKDYRDRLATRVAFQRANRPFLSYIGTDLLMHDMGYLSQVGNKDDIRDKDGVVLPEFKNHVQKIRTPALKGLQFNRFVTDSHRNTKTADDPACDFLLHDGRACDAIEAAFLHDGPAIKKLGVIQGLVGLTAIELSQLRAFLYSL